MGEVRKIAGGFGFVEGPVYLKRDGGFLIFSDTPADRVYRWTEAEGLSIFRTPAGLSNGHCATPDGRVIRCEHGGRRVSIEARPAASTAPDRKPPTAEAAGGGRGGPSEWPTADRSTTDRSTSTAATPTTSPTSPTSTTSPTPTTQASEVPHHPDLSPPEMNPAKGMVTLCDTHDNRRFNSPNDAVVRTDGMIFFTDPPYGLRDDARDRQKDQGGNYVFRFNPATGKSTVIADDFDMPNGLCFSPDEKLLYIGDSGKPHHIRVFDVADDGTLPNGRLFATIPEGVPDGMRCDSRGRLWSSGGKGIYIYAPSGEQVGMIDVPETPANLCFGAADYHTLFIVARTGLYSVRVNATMPENLKR